MSVNPTSSTSTIDPSVLDAIFNTNQMGKQDFLQLLVSQLRNQNPLEPMKDTEFVSQLATFSSLEQLAGMNATLAGIYELLKKQSTDTTNTQQT